MASLRTAIVRLEESAELLSVIAAARVAVMALEAIREACPDTDEIEIRIGRYDQARELAEGALLEIQHLLNRPPLEALDA